MSLSSHDMNANIRILRIPEYIIDFVWVTVDGLQENSPLWLLCDFEAKDINESNCTLVGPC